MKIEVFINGCLVFEEPIGSYGADKIANCLSQRFNIPLLQKCGVDAFLVISGVKSVMNYDWFELKPEAYDELHFKDIIE